jgi:hypothetical protein
VTNENSRITNPLADVPKDLLMKDVEDFAAEHGLDDIIPDLKKGALVAQDPARYDELEELDHDEKAALRLEILHKWKHPIQLYVTIIVCSIGAAVQ